MSDFQAEQEFFYRIQSQLRDLVNSRFDENEIAHYKGRPNDYATQLDLAAEALIEKELNRFFPNDNILAEENYASTKITNDRLWIIDPICGTVNLGKGMRTFCTNISLSVNQQLVAACVVDHCQAEYFWSVGGGNVYVNSNKFSLKQPKPGTLIDLDLDSIQLVAPQMRKKYTQAIGTLFQETDFVLQSINSSLSFAYTAVGKLDGFVNAINHPWDICAAAFLVQQSGGIVTDFTGKPWHIQSSGAIGADDSNIHRRLVEIFNAS